MGGAFGEDVFSRHSYCLEIQLAEQVYQQNIEYIAGMACRVGPCAGVQLLGNLVELRPPFPCSRASLSDKGEVVEALRHGILKCP
jgi:hypothetical protein